MFRIKKFYVTFLYVLFALVLTTGCSSDEGTGEEKIKEFKVHVTTYASSSEDNTNASHRASMVLEGSVFKVQFADGDVLLVWGKDANNKYFYGPLTLNSGSGTGSGTFSGELTVEGGGSATPLENYSDINAMLAPSDWTTKGYSFNSSTHAYVHSITTPYHIASSINELLPYLPIVKKVYENNIFTLKVDCSIVHAQWSGITASKELTINAYNQKDESGRVNYCGTTMTSNSDGVLEFYLPLTLEHGYYFSLVETSGGKEYLYDQTHNSAASSNVYKLIRTFLDNKSDKFVTTSGTTYVGSFNGYLDVPADATISLDGVTINSVSNSPVICNGDATIKIYGSNTLTANTERCPGIQPGGSDKTLTIQGKGSLTVTGGAYAAGIGAASGSTCGNIIINGGTINATGGNSGAGIGSGALIVGEASQCGNITISGGSVTATGGSLAASIGTGSQSKCGDITITNGATMIKTKKNETNPGPNFIGVGSNTEYSFCGTIKIDNQTSFSFVDGKIGCFTAKFDNYSWTLTKTSN